MRSFLLPVLLMVSGCATHSLGDEWYPLKEIKQSHLLAPSATGARVIGSTIYVRDVKDWLRRHPEPLLTAVLKHEQRHAIRQFAYPGGKTQWVRRYLADASFAWREEQLGWYEQIVYARSRGVVVIPEQVAASLDNYKTLVGDLVSYDEALTWVRDVLAGRWKPDADK